MEEITIQEGGFLLIDKPIRWTSFDVVKKLRNISRIKKIGHAGTLDPNDEGVLPIAINKATKLIPFISSNSKIYKFTIKWGEQTSTDDAEGDIINYSNKIPKKTLKIGKI